MIKLSQNNIETGEATFRNLLLQAPIAMSVVMGRDFNIEIVNKKQLELWQKEEAEILYKPLFDVLSEVKSQEFERLLTQVYVTGIPFTGKEIAAQLLRNGTLQTAYFDFTYEPLRNERGEVEGIILTSYEVTENVNVRKQSEEINQQLTFAIEAVELGTWDYNLNTNKFIGNNRLKDWFGLPHDAEIDLSIAINVMAEKDRSRVAETIQKALQNDPFGLYDIEYSIINPISKQERNVRAKGKAWFGHDKKPIRINGTLQDITKNKKLQEQISQSGEMFTSIFENSITAIVVTDDQGNYISANNAANKLLGFGVDELLQMNVRDIKTTAKDGAAKRFKEYISKGEETGEFNFITKEGAQKFVQYQAIRTKVNFNVSIMMDVTDQKVAETKLKANEERLQFERKSLHDFFTKAPAVLAILKGPEHVFEFANPAYLELIGKRTIINKRVLEAIPEVAGQGFIELLDNVYSTGETFTGKEMRLMLNRGNGKPETIFMNFTYQAFANDKGKTEGILVFAYNVSEQVIARKQIEESETAMRKMASHLKLATDSANVGTWSLELQTEKLEWSALHKKMWGYDEHRTDLTYEDWYTLLLPADKQKTFKKIEEAKIGHAPYQADYYIKRASDGALRCIRSYGKYHYNNKGEAETLTGISADITDQKEAELKLKTSEEKYRGLFETMEQGFCIIEMIFDNANKPIDYLFIEANPMFEKQSGTANPVGKTIRELVPNMEERWFENFGEVALKGQAKHFTDHSKELNRWFDVYAFRLENHGSNKVAVLFTNISQRKQAEEKIKENEAQFRVFADSIQNLAWIADGEGSIYWYNQRWLNYTGLTLEEMQGWGWQKVHHPDHVKNIIELSKELWKKNEPFELTFPLRRHDGQYRWFLTRAYPVLDANRNIERWIGTNTDITEQKNFTEQLEAKVKERTEELQIQNKTFALAEQIAKFGSYKWNMATDSLQYSDNLFLLLDCEPKEFEPSFKKFLSFIHPDDLQQVIKNGEETMRTGILVETPYRIVSKKGKIKHLRSSGSFTGANDNRILIGTVQDISNDIEAAEKLRTKNIELELINDELKSFSYVASHDLREPLRKINVFSKRIIETEEFSDKAQDYFNRIIKSAERMENLIDSLLDFSRVNTTELLFKPCDLNNLVAESINDFKISILEKQAIIEYNNLPTINGMYIQLSQLFTNLIDNSIKYSRSEIKPHIKITSSIIDGNEIEHPAVNKKKEYHAIKIADNGIGFEKEYSLKIFELFQRLHNKNEYSGTGIGLGIVKKIVTNHNGFIIATGQLNVGATFTIYLPTT